MVGAAAPVIKIRVKIFEDKNGRFLRLRHKVEGRERIARGRINGLGLHHVKRRDAVGEASSRTAFYGG